MNLAAVIVAAGNSTRAGPGPPKPYRLLAGEAVLAHAIRSLLRHDRIAHLRVVINHLHEGHYRRMIEEIPDLRNARLLPPVTGGATRGESVLAGLDSLESDVVLIHDGARPFPGRTNVDELIDVLERDGAAFLALPVHDTLWYVPTNGVVERGPERENLWRAQTPQGFNRQALINAYGTAGPNETDDVSVARLGGIHATPVTGCETNLKITLPGDLEIAERFRMQSAARSTGDKTGSRGGDDDSDVRGAALDVADRQEGSPVEFNEVEGPDIRTGTGFDVHRFTDGDHVILCGVKIPFGRSLEGHSDADVGLHAVTDAILGAMSEGDIGQWFSPLDDRWRDADSGEFLTAAVRRSREIGFRISNIDCTIICEGPRIGPHAVAMRTRIGALTGTSTGRISVKATTTEGLGFTGRGEGIAAMANVIMIRP